MAFAAPVALAGTALGGLIGAGGSLMQGQAQAGMYGYRAGVARLNQQIALQNAGYQTAAGETKAFQSGQATRFRMGAITAAQGASGLDINRGSAPLIRAGQQEIGLQEQTILRRNAQRLAYGQEVEASTYGAEAGADVAAGGAAKTAGAIGAVSSLISGATGVSSKWMQYSQAFPGSKQPDNQVLGG